MSERVTFFIDGTNLYFGLIKDLKRLDLDFQKLVQKLLNGRTLSRVYYYAVVPSEEQAMLLPDYESHKRQMKFLDALRHLPYFEVVLGRLVLHNTSYIEKGVDVAIALDPAASSFFQGGQYVLTINGFGQITSIAQR